MLVLPRLTFFLIIIVIRVFFVNCKVDFFNFEVGLYRIKFVFHKICFKKCNLNVGLMMIRKKKIFSRLNFETQTIKKMDI